MAKYLDSSGVSYLWSKIKTRLDTKMDGLRINGSKYSVSDAEVNLIAGNGITFTVEQDSPYTNCVVSSTGSSASVPTGTIAMFGGSSAPDGWLLCNGAAVSRSTYSDLFSAIGTTYGAGNGSTTFNLPDLAGKFPLGSDSANARGATGGAAAVTLTTEQIPAHTHGSKSITGQVGQVIVPGSDMSYSSDSLYFEYRDNVDYASDGYSNTCRRRVIKLNASHEHDSVGGNQAHNNMPPFLSVNYIIKT